MKNYIIALCMIFSHLGIAQNRQQIVGLRMSLSIANFYNSTLPKQYQPRELSWDMGLTTHILRTNRIGGMAEIGYAQKNVKNDDFGYSLHYFFINFMPNYYLPKSSTTLFLGGSGSVLDFYKIINDHPKSGERFEGYDLGVIAGFNQKLRDLGLFKIDVDTRFNLGLLNIRDDYWRQGKTQNYGFSVGLLIRKNARK
jgi:hypothetical protein